MSDVVAPLTNLMAQKTQYLWDDPCQTAFVKVSLVFKEADFEDKFKLALDASDINILLLVVDCLQGDANDYHQDAEV